jgi:hypothetical protein
MQMCFQSVLYGKQMYGTWADAGPLKVKNLVNNGHVKLNLQSNYLRF